MEGGPKNFEEGLPEEVEDYFLYIDALDLAPKDEALLKSLVTDKKRGRLTIMVGEDTTKEVDIDLTKTNIQLADEISKAFDDLYSLTLLKREQGLLQPGDPEEKMTVSFTETPLH